jgi:hypothetical protein
VDNLNVVLRAHYAYFGIAGNFRALHKVYRAVERYWPRCFAAGAGRAAFDGQCSIRSRRNLRCCDQSCISHTGSYKLALCCNQLPKSVVREIRTLRSVGAGGG